MSGSATQLAGAVTYAAHSSMVAYLDGERVTDWTLACPDGGWIEHERSGWGLTLSKGRKRGRVEVHCQTTGKVYRAERGGV